MISKYKININFDNISNSSFNIEFKKDDSHFMNLSVSGLSLKDFINCLKSGESNNKYLKVRKLTKQDCKLLIEHGIFIYNCSFCSGLDISHRTSIENVNDLTKDDYYEFETADSKYIICKEHCLKLAEHLEYLVKYGKCKITGPAMTFD